MSDITPSFPVQEKPHTPQSPLSAGPQTQLQAAYSFNSLSVVEFLWKWRLYLLGIAVLAVVASGIFSGPSFIPPKYASTVVFYASTTNSISKALLSDEGYNKEDPLAFGEEEQSEQLLQLLLSEDIKNRIIKQFDLMKHYDIDPNDPLKNYKLSKQYSENITFRRTEFMSVEIKVLDTDPKVAAAMANTIAAMLDETKRQVQKAQADKSLSIVEAAYKEKEAYIRRMNDSMQFLRSRGVFDYDLQTDNLSREYVRNRSLLSTETAKLSVYQQNGIPATDTTIIKSKARIQGARQALAELDKQLATLAQFGGVYNILKEQVEEANKQIVMLRDKLDKARVDATETLPVKFVVNSAIVSEKKVYPVRWLIVAVATFGSVLLAIVVLIAVENYRNLQARNRNAAIPLG